MLDSTSNIHELMHGCAALVPEEKAKNGDSVQKINLIIARRITRMCIRNFF